MSRVLPGLLLGHLLAIASLAGAQTARDARLTITVTDPSGGVVPNATVTITSLDETGGPGPKPLTTSEKGVVAFEGLAAGRYTVHADYSGFGTGLLKDVRLRAGDNKHIVVLPLKNMQDSVTVVQDAQSAAADPRGT